MKNFSWREWQVWARDLFQEQRTRTRRDLQTTTIESLEQRALLSGTSLIAIDSGDGDGGDVDGGNTETDEPPTAEAEATDASEAESTEPKADDPNTDTSEEESPELMYFSLFSSEGESSTEGEESSEDPGAEPGEIRTMMGQTGSSDENNPDTESTDSGEESAETGEGPEIYYRNNLGGEEGTEEGDGATDSETTSSDDPTLLDFSGSPEEEDPQQGNPDEEETELENPEVIYYSTAGGGDTETNSGPNHTPVASDNLGVTDEDVDFHGSVSPLGFDEDGDPLVYSIVSPPLHGTLTLSPDGTFVYKPNRDFNGTDSFTFLASDGQLESLAATFEIQASPVDDPFELRMPTILTPVYTDYVQIPISPTAIVGDVDTQLSYSGTTITATILAGGSSRDVLSIRHQGTGAGKVKVRKQALYFDGSSESIGRFTGGHGKPLVITFNANATEAAVNAVLKQIGFKTSRKGGTGQRSIGFAVKLGNRTAEGTVGVNVV